MSSLGVCDHCGKTFKQQNLNYGTVSGFWSEEYNYDLCDDCRSELDNWLNPETSNKLKDYINKDKKK